MPLTVGTRGYLFEPDYTEEELFADGSLHLQKDRVETSVETEGQERDILWWRHGNYKPMPTELECYCCYEWDLGVTSQLQEISESEDGSATQTVCITNHSEFPY